MVDPKNKWIRFYHIVVCVIYVDEMECIYHCPMGNVVKVIEVIILINGRRSNFFKATFDLLLETLLKKKAETRN